MSFKINWKLRILNKATLMSLLACVIAFIYQMAGILGFAVPISEEQSVQILGLFINVLTAIGVVIDPTTKGLKDSELAQTYSVPR